MVAMDMDGTLLLPNGTISPRAARALTGCEERGIKVILASGRSFFNIRAFYKQLGLKSPMLSVNGVRGDASCMGPLLFDSFLPESVTRAILPILRAEKVHFDLFTRYDIYDEFLDADFRFHDVPQIVEEDGMRHEIVVERPDRTDMEGAPHAYKLILHSVQLGSNILGLVPFRQGVAGTVIEEVSQKQQPVRLLSLKSFKQLFHIVSRPM